MQETVGVYYSTVCRMMSCYLQQYMTKHTFSVPYVQLLHILAGALRHQSALFLFANDSYFSTTWWCIKTYCTLGHPCLCPIIMGQRHG